MPEKTRRREVPVRRRALANQRKRGEKISPHPGFPRHSASQNARKDATARSLVSVRRRTLAHQRPTPEPPCDFEALEPCRAKYREWAASHQSRVRSPPSITPLSQVEIGRHF